METRKKDPANNIHDRENEQLSKVHHVYFKFTGKECVPGISFIVNKSGMFFLYMGDDPRSNPPTGIIVTGQKGGDLAYMDMEVKKEIEIITRGTIK